MNRRKRTWSVLAVSAVLVPAWPMAHADVRLPHVFGSHMMLQRDAKLPVWGWADPGEKITVQLDERPAVSAQADAKGKWQVTLPAIAGGGPLTLKVKGNNELILEDVLVGEVWIGSGQSNMQWSVRQSLNPDEEIAAAKLPQIRLLSIPRRPSGFPVHDVQAEWQVCSPDTVANFSACAYFLGRHLHRELKVPVGLINTSWGGTRIEPWTPPVGFEPVPDLKSIYEQVMLTDPKSAGYKKLLSEYLAQAEVWLKTARQALAEEASLAAMPPYPKELRALTHHQQPSTLYNGMVHALVPFAIRGAVWYQGESNHREGKLYTEKMKALIGGWRAVWQQGDFPFYYVQIAPYQYGSENPFILAEFWEAQAAALSIPSTGMVVTNDIGNTNNIHPRNKQEVGRRLGLIALAKVYGREGLVCSGPTFKSMAIEGNRIRLSFDHVGSGLASRDDKALTHFELIGKETDFVKATAVIDGSDVLVSSPEVKQPMAVRYAWHKNAEPNLMNKEGLPATPFRAGEVPKRDLLALRAAEAKDYTLVYDLDISKVTKDITYDVDNRARVAGPFDRIAYFLELQKAHEPVQYVYVSMDAFTKDLAKIGVPAYGAKVTFQQNVQNMSVLSNVEGIATGSGLTGGNIEFWSSNYGPLNSGEVPNASSSVWDFGDQPSAPGDGYGCMQIHNYEAKQTIFALNSWKRGANADLGIGNSPGKTRDWTFAANAQAYTIKRLRVFVRVKK